MNLCMDVLRLIAVRAIRDKTWAGPNVFDSPSSAGDIRIKGEGAPFISVYVDEQDVVELEGGSLAMPGMPNRIKLVIEVGVASGRVFNAANEELNPEDEVPDGGRWVTSIDPTDEGLEMQMGMIAQQCLDALNSTAANSVWAELFRTFTASMIISCRMRRGGPAGDQKSPAGRYASRVMIIETGTLGQPARGADLEDYPFWDQFFAVCEGDEELGGLANLIKVHMLGTGPIPAWRLLQKHLGVPLPTVGMMGATPAERDDDEVAVLQNVDTPGRPFEPGELPTGVGRPEEVE